MAPSDVWVYLEGYHNRIKGEWERTRLIAFNVARYGNSDPKKFPKTPQAFMPFAWDKKANVKRLSPAEILEQHRKMKEKREQLGKTI
jgi:hypothetical protein